MAEKNNERFPYGKDIEVYLDKALEKIKETLPWAARENFRDHYRYAIEEVDGEEKFVTYFVWSEDHIDKTVHDGDAEEFIDSVVSDQSWYIENDNPVSEEFKLDWDGRIGLLGDWCLERYEFRKHELGGYSAFVQGGSRTAGSSRTFFIPPRFFEGTWEEFLDQYCELVPGYFGFWREDLEKVEGLKEFLGF